MARRWPAQIVAMCKEEMRDWVAEQAARDEETIAGELRRIVANQRRLVNIAHRGGYSVEEVLSNLEKQLSSVA